MVSNFGERQSSLQNTHADPRPMEDMPKILGTPLEEHVLKALPMWMHFAFYFVKIRYYWQLSYS